MSKPNPFPDHQPDSGKNNPYSAPIQSPHPDEPQQRQDATGGLIPYKNPHALLAYYLGIGALIPLLGIPLGIASISFGISGLRKYKRDPAIKGSVHAWIGIAGGVLALICGGAITIAIAVAAFG